MLATADDLVSTDRASSPRNTRRRVFPGRRKPYLDAESLASRTLVLAHREPMPHRVPTCSAPASRGPHTTDRGTHHGRVPFDKLTVLAHDAHTEANVVSHHVAEDAVDD